MPSAQDQNSYNLIVKQVLSFSAKNGAQLEGLIKQAGPVKGLIAFLDAALEAVGRAAASSGAKIKQETVQAALKEIVTMLCATMKASGMVQDVPSTAQQVLKGVQHGAA